METPSILLYSERKEYIVNELEQKYKKISNKVYA